MAQHAVMTRGSGIVLACRAFVISLRCYRQTPLLADENEDIENWLVALTKVLKSWGFGCGISICATSKASDGPTNAGVGFIIN